MGGREFLEAGVELRKVDRLGRIECIADRAGTEVDLEIRPIVADEKRPAEEACFASLIELIVPSWTTRTIATGVGPDISPVKKSGPLVDVQPPWIAASHDVDLWMTGRAIFGEQIPFGDTISPIVVGPNPQDFAVVTVGIGAGPQSVKCTFLLAFVDRCKALGISKRVGVVPRADVQTAIGTKFHRAGMVATLLPLLLVLHQELFALEIQRAIGSECKAADVLA